MRILHVIHSVDPRSGGPSNSLRELLAAQRQSGLLTSLVTTTTQSAEPWSDAGEFRGRMEADPAFAGTELFMGRSYGRRRPWNRYAYTPECARWLKNRCRDAEKRPDVVHIHGVYSHLTQTAAATATRAGIPYVIRPAGSLDPVAMGLRSRWLKRLAVRLSLRRQLREAAFVQATSEAEAEAIRQGFPEARVVVVPHGVQVPQPAAPELLQMWYARFPNLRGRRQVLFISRLHAKKQPELLVRAVAELRREFPELVLVLAGPDAGHRGAIEVEVRHCGVGDSVVFTDFVQGDLKRAAFAAASVFALPSKHENYGFAVVEAMAHGVPVLVSPHVATHTYVDESGAGLTVSDTVDEVTKGLRALLRGDCAGMGARGRRFVQERISWTSVEASLRSHYEAAVAAGGSGGSPHPERGSERERLASESVGC